MSNIDTFVDPNFHVFPHIKKIPAKNPTAAEEFNWPENAFKSEANFNSDVKFVYLSQPWTTTKWKKWVHHFEEFSAVVYIATVDQYP